jgi:hypothetical protein
MSGSNCGIFAVNTAIMPASVHSRGLSIFGRMIQILGVFF